MEGGAICYADGVEAGEIAVLQLKDEKDCKAYGHRHVVTLEDGVADGGFGEKITRFYGNTSMRVLWESELVL